MSASESEIRFEDLGMMDYQEAWDYQEERFNALVEFKRKQGLGERPHQFLLFCEHPHVYTLGKSGDEHNLLIRQEFLRKIDATYYKTNRGGDITYHGPGQLVGYPILDLERFSLGLRQYISLLEEAIIRLLADYGIEASHMEGATGVWLDGDHPVKARKICAIGVRSSRHITMHGFALNVNTDLSYFDLMIPCGIRGKGVTSLSRELGRHVPMDEVKQKLMAHFLSLFEAT